MPPLQTLRKRLRRDAVEPETQSDGAHGAEDPMSPGIAALLAEARQPLDEIAQASSRASASIRQLAIDPPKDVGQAEELLGALGERIDAMEEEAQRLVRLLDRTAGRLAPPVAEKAETYADHEHRNGVVPDAGEEGPVAIEQVRALVALLAGAGASRQEIAAWVFREQGVVVADDVMEEVVHHQQAPPG